MFFFNVGVENPTDNTILSFLFLEMFLYLQSNSIIIFFFKLLLFFLQWHLEKMMIIILQIHSILEKTYIL